MTAEGREQAAEVAAMRRLLVEARTRIRHDPMEVGPHRCPGCDLEGAIDVAVEATAEGRERTLNISDEVAMIRADDAAWDRALGATGREQRPEGVPVERLRALVRLLWPDEITPTAKRMIESICEEYDRGK